MVLIENKKKVQKKKEKDSFCSELFGHVDKKKTEENK